MRSMSASRASRLTGVGSLSLLVFSGLLAFLLFDLYAGATLMALFLIYGLSRAVNRLSRATGAVRAGSPGLSRSDGAVGSAGTASGRPSGPRTSIEAM